MIEANSVDPDQTAPEQSDLGPQCLLEVPSTTFQQMTTHMMFVGFPHRQGSEVI